MSKLNWKKEKRKVSELKAADYNPRKMTEAEERDLEESIEEYGAVIPLVVNIGKRKNILIGGHQRTRLYEKKGIKEVDVMVPSRQLTVEEEKKLNLRLNKNVGSWDPSKLKDMDITMLLEVGFDDDDLQLFFDDVDMIDDQFSASNNKEETIPKVRPGDIYELGDHRLMCGDATDPNQVEKLMRDDLADMIYCDPPNKIIKKKNKKVTYESFNNFAIQNALEYSKPNSHFLWWTNQKSIGLIQSLYNKLKISNKGVCLWIKGDLQISNKNAFNSAYEPCVYGVKGDPYLNDSYKGLSEIINKGVGSGSQGLDEILEIINIWLDKKSHDDKYNKSSQKPVTLAEKPLKRCTSPGHIVLDLFAGSGPTAIACQQLNRHARLMEIDPVLCDTIIERWEEFTNKKAKKCK